MTCAQAASESPRRRARHPRGLLPQHPCRVQAASESPRRRARHPRGLLPQHPCRVQAASESPRTSGLATGSESGRRVDDRPGPGLRAPRPALPQDQSLVAEWMTGPDRVFVHHVRPCHRISTAGRTVAAPCRRCRSAPLTRRLPRHRRAHRCRPLPPLPISPADPPAPPAPPGAPLPPAPRRWAAWIRPRRAAKSPFFCALPRRADGQPGSDPVGRRSRPSSAHSRAAPMGSLDPIRIGTISRPGPGNPRLRSNASLPIRIGTISRPGPGNPRLRSNASLPIRIGTISRPEPARDGRRPPLPGNLERTVFRDL